MVPLRVRLVTSVPSTDEGEVLLGLASDVTGREDEGAERDEAQERRSGTRRDERGRKRGNNGTRSV